jgi:hypothetical protein
VNAARHVPVRPAWHCAACGEAWPCAPAKAGLRAEAKESRTAIVIYLGLRLAEAVADLRDTDPETLHTRIFEWWWDES